VIVGYLDVVRIAILEAKADPPLVVDADRVLTLSISTQGMESVAGGNSEIIKLRCMVNIFQSPNRPPQEVGRQSPRFALGEQVARVLVSERLDHW